MPKNEIDYSNTIIYKITCNDSNITDKYVGHTTNFVQRKYAHKDSCVNEKSSNHKCKLYETIRQKGGWSNWKMEIINFFNCKDHYEARIKEQEYFVLLNANLNSIEPVPKPKIKNVIEPKIKQTIYCETCKVNFTNLKLLEIHNTTKKHLKFSNNLQQKSSAKFFCEKCDYKCSKHSDYLKHLLTLKHKNDDTDDVLDDTVLATQYFCECGKEYKHRQGLWRHKKLCNKHNMNISTNIANIPPTNYECESCFIHCNKLSDWNRHVLTKKHIVNITGGKSTIPFTCDCGNIYKERTGLWKHKKKCIQLSSNKPNYINKSIVNEIPVTNDLIQKDNLIEYLIKENAEFKTLIMELIKKDNTKYVIIDK